MNLKRIARGMGVPKNLRLPQIINAASSHLFLATHLRWVTKVPRVWAVSLIILVVISSFNALASSAVRWDSIIVLAVSGGSEGVRGVPLELRIGISEGRGNIFLSINTLSTTDFQSSLRMAILLATLIIGANYRRYDFYVELRPQIGLVSGPSASAAVAILTAALLKNHPISGSVAVTGLVLPDTTIGPVGALREKVIAACRSGAKVLIVPKAQIGIANKTLMELGSKCSLRLIGASSLYDALEKLDLLKPTHGKVLRLNSVKGLRGAINSWIRNFNSTISYINATIASHLRESPGCSNKLINYVENFLTTAHTAYRRALNEYKGGKYYAAVSDMFLTTIYLDSAYWLLKVCRDSNALNELKVRVIAKVRKSMDIINNVIDKAFTALKKTDLNELSILVEVAKRAYEANDSLNELIRSYGNTSVINVSLLPVVIQNYIYTYWRADSAIKWSSLIRLMPRSKVMISRDEVLTLTEMLLRYIRTALDYLNDVVLVNNSAFKKYVGDLRGLIDNALGILRREPLISLAIGMRVLADISSTLSTLYAVNLSSKAVVLRNIALELSSKALRMGFLPLITLTYVERGDTLLSSDAYSSIYFYDLAVTNTMWYLLITHASSGSFAEVTASLPNAVLNKYYVVVITVLSLLTGFLLGYYVRLRMSRS